MRGAAAALGAAAIALAVAAGCGRRARSARDEPPPSPAARFAGCYEILAPGTESAGQFSAPHHRFRLDHEPEPKARAKGALRAHRLRTPPRPPPATSLDSLRWALDSLGLTFWRPTAANSIEVSHDNEMAGTVLYLHAEGEVLRGRVDGWITHVARLGEPGPRVDITAHPIPCP